jgi:phosphate transport system protein
MFIWVHPAVHRARPKLNSVRAEYDAELEDVSRILVTMADAVRTAMSQATAALLRADRDLAQRVISNDAAVNEQHWLLEERVYGLLARQAPVASDLRLLFTALHIGADLERMGDLAKHVAKVGLRRAPFPAVPASLTSVIEEMAAVADRIAAKIGAVLATPDALDAATLALDDDEMDRLNEGVFVILLGAAWRDGVESAIDGAMLGRFYERYADHAVNAGRRMYFFVTGQALSPIDVIGSTDA